jgi:peptidoglycan/LPS O-acetylase OafA/YrhL
VLAEWRDERCAYRLAQRLSGFELSLIFDRAGASVQTDTGSGEMSSAVTNRYAHIDAMRAVAVMLVVVGHAGLGSIVPGGSGVTIFFSISGFIITFLLLRERSRTGGFLIGSFYLRRLLKIGPPLLVCVIIPTLILACFQEINWSPVIGIVFFYFNWFLAVGGPDAPLPGSGVVWSLSIEEQFYLAFALIWLATISLRVRTRYLGFVAGIVALASLVTRIVIASTSAGETRIYYGSDTRIDGIALGVVTAIAFYHSLKSSGRVYSVVQRCAHDAALITAIALYLFSLVIRNEWFRETFRFSLQGIAACLVILYGFGAHRTRVRRAFNALVQLKIVQIIGLASYSIYLVHLIAMSYTIGYIPYVTTKLPGAVQVVLLMLIGVCTGILIYYCVERPVQGLRHRYKALRQPEGTAEKRDA